MVTILGRAEEQEFPLFELEGRMWTRSGVVASQLPGQLKKSYQGTTADQAINREIIDEGAQEEGLQVLFYLPNC